MKTSEQLFSEMMKANEVAYNHRQKLQNCENIKFCCDAIESGKALTHIKKRFGNRKKYSPTINPNNIDNVRIALGFDGPARSTVLRSDELKRYIELRELERINKVGPTKKTPSAFKRLESILGELEHFEDQTYIRSLVEEGNQAKKKLISLTKGLKKIPGIPLSQLTKDHQNVIPIAEEKQYLPVTKSDNNREISKIIGELIQRLKDNEELTNFALKNEAGRIKQSIDPGKTLIKPKEFTALETAIDLLKG
ncbi:hypothetical protein WH95_13520 [Kiloniella litopenaei]|uniref:Uncharacterized protein n=1 Tax=Kiloniella litopenaei TaxID=1549748 RepID=A0A0M2R301_9PROT|nr:hypothetical protein [Kiloniella litopenaei]KKJ76242.1 hypothetical protein WH95_13520 [Kiloniella litopenaei]